MSSQGEFLIRNSTFQICGASPRPVHPWLHFLLFCFLILAILCLFSCEEYFEPRSVVVELPEHQPVLVVNGFINPDSVSEVSISKSTGFLAESENQFVRNADVRLSENGTQVTTLVHIGEGVYRASSHHPSQGATYRLDVVADGFEPIRAEAVVPTPIAIDSVSVRATNPEIPWSNEYDLTIFFTDPPVEDNFYQVIMLERRQFPEQPGSQIAQEGFRSSDPVLLRQDDFGDQQWFYSDAYFDDALFDGESYGLELHYYVYSGDALRDLWAALLTTTESYHYFRKTVDQQDNSEENPFAEPVQIFSNVEKGLGVFAAYSASKFTIDLRQQLAVAVAGNEKK